MSDERDFLSLFVARHTKMACHVISLHHYYHSNYGSYYRSSFYGMVVVILHCSVQWRVCDSVSSPEMLN